MNQFTNRSRRTSHAFKEKRSKRANVCIDCARSLDLVLGQVITGGVCERCKDEKTELNCVQEGALVDG